MSEETPPSAATHWLLMRLYVSPEGLGDAEGPGDAPSNLSAVALINLKEKPLAESAALSMDVSNANPPAKP